jgi:hypothetical protein
VRAVSALGLVLAIGSGCSSDSSSAQTQPQQAAPPPLIGVYPEDFKCESVAPPDALAQALGGAPRVVDSAIQTPQGVARPCNYLVDGPAGPEAWTFDIDCRPGWDTTAQKLFEQYTRGSQDLVEQYNAVVDAGHLETVDGGPAIKAPENAHEVQVGKKALDHHGQGLIFIDDDAPCYVRVIGPDAARRLALAQLIARNLTPARAPMPPHAAQ